jgi:hypothetical protein
MSKQIDLNKLENKLREKIKSLRYFMVPFEYFEKEIMSVLREFGIESDYCNYFVNYGETIAEDEHKDYIIRYEIATDELSCDEISAEIKMKRLIYKEDDIDPDVRIDVIELIDIKLDIDYEDEEDDDYIEDEDFDEDVSDYYEEYDDEDVSDYYMDLLDSQYEDIFNRYDDIIVIDDP